MGSGIHYGALECIEIRFPMYLKLSRSIGRFFLNIFGDLLGGKLAPVLV